MTHKEIHDELLGYKGAKLEYPFGKESAVYKAPVGDELKMFAIVAEESDPLRISLKCAPELAVVLREKYVTVLPGYHLNKKHWNTLILTGQLEDQEVKDLISHSYQLVTGTTGR